jgi:glycosyltransferase EpsE
MTDASPLISVIIPVHDGVPAPLFAAAVLSILDQTERDLELLVMLDGVAVDALSAEARRAEAEDSRVRVFRHAEREGIAASLNDLIAEARGRFIARMDADDVSHPERLREQAEFLKVNPEVSILGVFAEEVDEAGRVTFEKRLPTGHDAIVRFLGRRDPFVHPTVMFRRELFDVLGGYSTLGCDAYLEDTELWTRAIAAGARCRNLPKFLYRFLVTNATYATGRRRGTRIAFREAQLRLRHVASARLPAYDFGWPVLVFAARLCPPPFLRTIYKYFR